MLFKAACAYKEVETYLLFTPGQALQNPGDNSG